MHQRWVATALLTSVFELGALAGFVRAQTPPPPPTPLLSNPPLVQPYDSSFQATVAPEAIADVALVSPVENPGPHHPIRDILHKPIDCIHRHVVNHPWYCWATHNSIGCGSFCADSTFIFGSCRKFYGESCLKGPPPVPVPPGYGYGYASAGCPCP